MTNQDILSFLLQNMDKNFVQRIFAPGIFPVINNDDGSVSSHLMASQDNMVFPTITQDPQTGKLTNNMQYVWQNPFQKAVEAALKNNDVIYANNPEDADQIASGGYKEAGGWNK